MAKVYDSEKLNRVGRSVRRNSENLECESLIHVKRTADDLDALTGKTREALECRIEELVRDLAREGAELESIGRLLMKYAQDLEEADARLVEQM